MRPDRPHGPRMLGRLAPDRLGGVLLGASVLVFLAGSGWVLADPATSYSWWHNMFSDLGRTTCQPSDGRWVCAPRHAAFNAALIASGLLMAAGAALLARRWGWALTAGIGGTAAGLVILGTFPSDVAPRIHLAGAVLTLPVPAAGWLLSALRPLRARCRASTPAPVRASLGAGALLLNLVHLVPQTELMPRGAAEVLALSIVVALLLFESYAAAGARR